MSLSDILLIAGAALIAIGVVITYLKKGKIQPKAIQKSGVDIARVLEGVGGKDNVEAVSANGSKVAFTLKDTRLVQSELLKGLGASGIVQSKQTVNVIFGKVSDVLAQEIAKYLKD